jgi:hypothetical protein
MAEVGNPDKELSEMFARAAEIAKLVPEAMQDAAFNRALDLLVDPSTRSKPAAQTRKRARQSTSRREKVQAGVVPDDDPVKILMRMRRDQAPGVDLESGVLAKSLALLRVSFDELEIDGLGASQIAKVLTEKFRFRASRQAVNQALDRAGPLVDRRADTTPTKYFLMDAGVKFLDTPVDERSQTKAATKRRVAKSSKTKKTVKTVAKKAKPAKKVAAKGSGREVKKSSGPMGPKPSILYLIGSGFLSEPRTLQDMCDELDLKRGVKFKSDQISSTIVRLLRDGTLIRTRNSENQYEYTTS